MVDAHLCRPSLGLSWGGGIGERCSGQRAGATRAQGWLAELLCRFAVVSQLKLVNQLAEQGGMVFQAIEGDRAFLNQSSGELCDLIQRTHGI